MRKNLSPIVVLFIGLFLLSLGACMNDDFPVVGPPDDVAGDSITTPPDRKEIHKKVLIIGLGGIRGDAMRMADAPQIHALLTHSVYSFDALTEAPTWSATGWSAMLTGVWSNKHRVTDDSFTGNRFDQYPMMFKYIKQLNPQLKTVSICSWTPINDLLVSGADLAVSTGGNDIAVRDSAIAVLSKDDPDVVFLEFEEVELSGRQNGIDTAFAGYMQSISKVDGYVGDVLTALRARPDFVHEDWLIVLSTDHGGTAGGYGGTSYPERNTFVVYYNPAFPSKEQVPPETTLKAAQFRQLDQYANLRDPDDVIDFDQSDGFTVLLSVKAEYLTGYDAFLTNKDWESGLNKGWIMTVSGSHSWGFNIGDGTHRVDVEPDAPDLDDGKWHTIGFTVQKGEYVKLFQDDSLYNYAGIAAIDSWNGEADTYGVKLNTGDDITNHLSQRYGNSIFSVANIKIWNTAISDADMQTYSACDTSEAFTGGKYDDHLVAWWKAIDGAGTVWKDYGPHQLDMDLIGNPSWLQQQMDFCSVPLPPSVPTTVDVVPTVFEWLGIPLDSDWSLDGVSWLP